MKLIILLLFLITGVSESSWCQSAPCTTKDRCHAFFILTQTNNSLSLSSKCGLVCGSPYCLYPEFNKCYRQCMGMPSSKRHVQDGNIIGIMFILIVATGFACFYKC